MEIVQKLLEEHLNSEFIKGIISNPRKNIKIQKVKIRPILIKEKLGFQFERFEGKQVFHSNYHKEEAIKVLVSLLEDFRQLQIETKAIQGTVLVSKKGKVTSQIKKQEHTIKKVSLSHNREKTYILQEGVMVPFLYDLGIMTEEGKIVKKRFDKFRQINRFLEFVEDILPNLNKEKEISILDFGCGKSYLTFAMYYYLSELKGLDVKMIGLDLKTDVIEACNKLSKKYGYEKLIFLEGDIAGYSGETVIDMVVALHACDTATDYALAKAVEWETKVILAVPCCQHEVNKQIKNELFKPILKYGLIKERIASLVTDAMRAEYLTSAGYETQILEFIDVEHTPKNILIRGIKSKDGEKSQYDITALKKLEGELHITPTIGTLLK